MSDPKATALFYLKLSSQGDHLGYVRGLAARRSYDFRPSSRGESKRDSPFSVAGRIFREELHVTKQAERKTKMIKDLLSDRMKTARLLAAEAYPALPNNRGKGRNSSLSQHSMDFREDFKLPLVQKRPKILGKSRLTTHAHHLGRLNSIIAVCSQETNDTSRFKQKLTTEKDANQQEFRSFKGTLELVESLGEHKPELLAQLYVNRVKMDQEAVLDSYLLQRLDKYAV